MSALAPVIPDRVTAGWGDPKKRMAEKVASGQTQWLLE
jgi:hypothetical protein